MFAVDEGVWNEIKMVEELFFFWMDFESVGLKTKILHQVLKSSQTPRGKRHSGINVCSTKRHTLKNGVVSWLKPRRRHKVFMGWFRGIQRNKLLCEVVNEPYERPSKWRTWSKTEVGKAHRN